MRVGLGYDVHKLVEGRKLILGGVEIPYEKGLLGHSDADVLVHAIMDALLGAAGLGDIGRHFPDTDPKYKGADSMVLLKEVRGVLEVPEDCVNIKATTEEGLGFTGSGEGMSAQAICALETIDSFSYDVTGGPAGCNGCAGCPRP